jgi:drug/metabolite transporter (DMT)-like permease
VLLREPGSGHAIRIRRFCIRDLVRVIRRLCDLGFDLSRDSLHRRDGAPFFSAAARFIISGTLLYLWRRTAGDPRPTAIEWRNAAIIGIFLLVGGNGGVVWAAQFIPSNLSALLVATVPLWMILINALRAGGDGPNFRSTAGILIGFCGAVLLIGWTTDSATSAHLYGALAVLTGSIFWAIGSIYGKAADLPASSLITTGVEMLAGGIGQMTVSFALGEFENFSVHTISSRSALAWAYLTVIGPAAFVAYAWLLRVAPIPLVATYSYVNPLVAILLGYFLGKEIITTRILLAATLIIASVILVSAPKRPHR